MLNIRINNLKVISINNLGSLNIGHAILCNNQATTNTYQGQVDGNDDGDGDDGSIQTPFINAGNDIVSPLADQPDEELDNEQEIQPEEEQLPLQVITPALIDPL